MPSSYTHYRFGRDVLALLPPERREAICRHRALFDLGLHGPDLFFFHKPYQVNSINAMGRRMHTVSGKEVFHRFAVLRERTAHPEAVQAYLDGFLCHFVLDVRCRSLTDPDPEAERAFDRFLMEQDGVCLPLWTHMGLTGSECALVSRFYPGTDKTRIRRSLRTMAGELRRRLTGGSAP